jgi:hypothetical protein
MELFDTMASFGKFDRVIVPAFDRQIDDLVPSRGARLNLFAR